MDAIEFFKKELGLIGKPSPRGWYRACCPIHGEQTPSFAIFTEYPFHYKCMACGAGGQLPKLVSIVRNMPLEDARQFVMDHLKVVINPSRLFPEKTTPEAVSDALVEAYQSALRGSYTERYCRKRGIPKFVTDAFGVGHDQLNLSMVVPVRAVTDSRIIGFDIRGFFSDSPSGIDKSVLVPEGWKSRVVIAPWWYRKARTAVVVEGFFDAARVLLWTLREGMSDTVPVATSGVGLSDDQVALLGRFDRVIVGYDEDEAGERARAKIVSKLNYLPLLRLNYDKGDPGESDYRDFSTSLLTTKAKNR